MWLWNVLAHTNTPKNDIMLNSSAENPYPLQYNRGSSPTKSKLTDTKSEEPVLIYKLGAFPDLQVSSVWLVSGIIRTSTKRVIKNQQYQSFIPGCVNPTVTLLISTGIFLFQKSNLTGLIIKIKSLWYLLFPLFLCLIMFQNLTNIYPQSSCLRVLCGGLFCLFPKSPPVRSSISSRYFSFSPFLVLYLSVLEIKYYLSHNLKISEAKLMKYKLTKPHCVRCKCKAAQEKSISSPNQPVLDAKIWPLSLVRGFFVMRYPKLIRSFHCLSESNSFSSEQGLACLLLDVHRSTRSVIYPALLCTSISQEIGESGCRGIDSGGWVVGVQLYVRWNKNAFWLQKLCDEQIFLTHALCNIIDNSELFGGKVMVFSGKFCQMLPVFSLNAVERKPDSVETVNVLPLVILKLYS
ncbi:hypothetical protein VP01_1011g3 [Puccinia sorghi]|uniref:Uncharacterized protein n=1 Tax=Puccinia sorghi TaxID=27349 RepID=A0A0L6VV84_9BASI|nr:hypothetical protein VP01_1011g3 [Puccinia sorghi]